MYGGTPWGYIQKKNELEIVKNNVRNYKIAHSKWLKEGDKLIRILREELQKDQPDLSKIQNMSESIAKHLRHSADIEKEFL